MLKTYLAKATENVTTGVKWNHHTVSMYSEWSTSGNV